MMRMKCGKATSELALAWLICGVSGCQSLPSPTLPSPSVANAPDIAPPNPIQQVSNTEDESLDDTATPQDEDLTLTERAKKLNTRTMNFLAGREQEDLQRAKELYQEGDAAFRQAAQLPAEERAKSFAKAAKLFRRAGEAAPGTALQQDALYMQGESLFFADQLVDAADVYQKLQKEFPRNRHIDQVAARLFSISRYWIETAKANEKSWVPINLTDDKRPRLDVDGHAVRVLDQIRYDDPTGRLADDATMAAAVEHIRQEKFEEADEFLTDLRETFTDSEHLFLAHMLGIRVKLECYHGPRYSGLILEEAEKLVKQTRERFPEKMAEKDYGERVSRASAEIAFLQAERLRFRAEYREKRNEFGAARYYYQQLLEQYADTPHADTAREKLAKLESYPSLPPQRLSWLTTIFPDSTASGAPLEFKQPTNGDEPKTMLR